MVVGALDVRGAQGVRLGCAVLQLGSNGEGSFDGQRGEGIDEQLPDLLVQAAPGTAWQIRRPREMPSRWHT